MTAQKTYRLCVLEGEYRGKDRTYKKGDVFESPYPLDKMFVNKFQRMSENVILDEILTPRRNSPDTRMMFVFADSTDVTASYPQAQENNVTVHEIFILLFPFPLLMTIMRCGRQ